MRKLLITGFILSLIFAVFGSAFAQVSQSKELRKLTASPDQYISMLGTLPFNDALDIFNDFSKRYLGKVIIDPSEIKSPIGVNINKMYWLDALEKILMNLGLKYTEYSDHIIISRMGQIEAIPQAVVDAGELFVTREVKISAVFFEANITKLRQIGFSWGWAQKDSTSYVNMSASDTKSSLFEINVTDHISIDGKDFGDIAAVFKALENEQAGDVIASPQIVVMSDEKGRIQVGSNYSITVQDFAGNAITQFIETGSIIEVTPHITQVDSQFFIHLELSMEKSSATSAGEGIEIKKSSAKTTLLLIDGEETVIGGLYSNEVTSTREGVPFLMDLPWWFLGLRYIFGYEQNSIIKKELLLLLKAELLPTLSERIEIQLKRKTKTPKLEEFLKEQDQLIEDITGKKRE